MRADWIPALVLAATSLIVAIAVTAGPRAGEAVAAVFPPWVHGDGAIAAVAGLDPQEIRGFGAVGTIVVARSDDPLFPEKLRQSGAVLIVAARNWADCTTWKGTDHGTR